MVNIALIGAGYWGPNLLRNLVAQSNARVVAICDADTTKAEKQRTRHCPEAAVVADYHQLLEHRNLNAVVIATPIRTHFEIGSAFLEAGKHTFIEKPLARNALECARLIALAEANNLVLMVGHVFEYNNAVRMVKKYLQSGELGKLFYVTSQRVNLGRIQNDVNALWSFAPHDISIMNYWLDQEPIKVSARGFSYLNNSIEDVVFLTLEYPDNVGAHLHLGWLDPRKIRLMALVGSKKMLVYDDVSLDHKIKLYDKGIQNLHDYIEAPESFAEFQFQVRSGDMVVPAFKFSEPLETECRHFIDCIEGKCNPNTDGYNALRVVRVLEAAEESLRHGGKTILLGSTEKP